MSVGPYITTSINTSLDEEMYSREQTFGNGKTIYDINDTFIILGLTELSESILQVLIKSKNINYIIIFDDSYITEEDALNGRYPISDVGKPKMVVTSSLLTINNPYKTIVPIFGKLNKDTINKIINNVEFSCSKPVNSITILDFSDEMDDICTQLSIINPLLNAIFPVKSYSRIHHIKLKQFDTEIKIDYETFKDVVNDPKVYKQINDFTIKNYIRNKHDKFSAPLIILILEHLQRIMNKHSKENGTTVTPLIPYVDMNHIVDNITMFNKLSMSLNRPINKELILAIKDLIQPTGEPNSKIFRKIFKQITKTIHRLEELKK